VPCSAWHRAGVDGVADGAAALIQSEAGPGGTVVIGAHGCDTTEQGRRVAATIERKLGSALVVVLNDAELLLPAAGVVRGVGLVCGTGSIVIGYLADGSLLSVGGWGGYLAEEGSGTGLFRDAARAVVEGHDRGAPRDPLEDLLLELLELEELRDLPAALGDMKGPTSWAHLTPPLFERALAAGSPLVHQVIEASAEALVGLVALAGSRGCDTATVVAGGGLVANAPWLQQALRRALARTCPRSEFVVLASPPVDGALALATELAQVRCGAPAGGAPADGTSAAGAHHSALTRFMPLASATVHPASRPDDEGDRMKEET
jgi:glucosamine kinase